MVLRHGLSILLLPFLVVVLVPYWLLSTSGHLDHPLSEGTLLVWLLRAAGMMCFLGGLLLFSWCIVLFARIGRGTLAPWDPTRNLVSAGPYRLIRNPMIGGVALMLLGEALLWGSWMLGLWAIVFLALNHLYFVYSEEPGLEKRFGESYQQYMEDVPRWIPNLRPKR